MSPFPFTWELGNQKCKKVNKTYGFFAVGKDKLRQSAEKKGKNVSDKKYLPYEI